MKNNSDYLQYKKLLKSLEVYQLNKIPLCAAETYVSNFVKSALSSEFEGKYCMEFPYGGHEYNFKNDFIGGQYIFELFKMVEKKCKEIFNSKYVDLRALSGMNCDFVTFASLLKTRDRVLITDSNQGGHASIPKLLDIIGVEYESIPYDYDLYDINYSELNILLKTNHYDAIILAQSDLLNPADVSKIDTDDLIIYDATQTLGMICTHTLANPLDYKKNIVLVGGTHKTFPGPTCGMILTNNYALANKLCTKVSPDILRNVQPNNVAAAYLTLLELDYFGHEYHTNIIKNANFLAKELEKRGFKIAKINSFEYTKTHQVFILTSKEEMDNIFSNAYKFNVTLNKKSKKLFNGYGIRLGTQEITRYGWNTKDIIKTSFILKELNNNIENIDQKKLEALIKDVASKKTNVYKIKE